MIDREFEKDVRKMTGSKGLGLSHGPARFACRPFAAALGALALSAMSLSGCGTLRPLPPPATPYDYRDRHPIVMTESPFVLDLFPRESGGRLDPETRERVKSFIQTYAQFGGGPVTIASPTGSTSARIYAQSSGHVAQMLRAGGIRDVRQTDYAVTDVALAAPIRLTFNGLKAKVADRCGLWPRDLASGTSIDGWQNETYWNFGCATQNLIATQAADPRDIVSPRGSTPADIEMRMRGIGKVRQGVDPATNWIGKNSSISGVGG